MRSVMNHSFSQVAHTNIQRSSFDRSCGYKTTFNASYLVPFFIDLAYPSDTFNLSCNIFVRQATPKVPLMDNLFLDIFFFAVPLRLTWDGFEEFMGANDEIQPPFVTKSVPMITAPDGTGGDPTGYQTGTLQDYMGLPVGAPGFTHSALPLRAYYLIRNEWFRSQALEDALEVDIGDSAQDWDDFELQKSNKRFDYFTSCLPYLQKGPSVPMPMGTSAPIEYYSASVNTNPVLLRRADTRATVSGAPDNLQVDVASHIEGAGGGPDLMIDPNDTLYTDLSNAVAPALNELRTAAAVQQFYEQDARGGTRFTEVLYNHFKVVSPDARLQRPEFLCSFTRQIIINPVVQTSASDTQPTPQGNLAAYGVASISENGFIKSFVEHSYIIGIMRVRADLSYQNALDREWSYESRFDFVWPTFANLGEQAVLVKEIDCKGPVDVVPTSNDDDVFGYNERYAEARFKTSKITGLFRSNATTGTPLDQWHAAQEFADQPTLNAAFINEDVPMSRLNAVPSEPDFLFDSYMKINCVRPLPLYSTPGLLRF